MLNYRDTNGQLWQITVATDGSLQTTAIASAPVSVPGQNNTVTVQSVANYASVHTELMPLIGVGGYANEPTLSIANDVLSQMLAPPFPWKFNRKTMPLMVTSQNRQDYKFGGATVFTLKGASVYGGVGVELAANNGITESGFTVTVNTLDPHNFSAGDVVYMNGNTVAAYNSTETITPTSSTWTGGWTVLTVPGAKSFTFTHASSGLAISGAPGISDFGWLEYATAVDENETSSPRFIRYMEAARSLQPISSVGLPDKIAMSDNGDGTITVRLSVAPGAAAYGITALYQGRAPLLLNLTDTWAPVPDQFAYIVRQLFLAAAFRYVGSARSENEFQKAGVLIQLALREDDAELSEEYIAPATPLMELY